MAESVWRATVATQERFQLAEGPCWDARRGRLWWVDIIEGDLLAGVLSDGTLEIVSRQRFHGTLGAVAVGEQGVMALALQRSVALLTSAGEVVAGPVVLADRHRRLNDGAVDPAGRFLVGSLTMTGEPAGGEVLVRWDGAGRVETLDDDLSLSNGIAWSVDGSVMFHVDSLAGVVYRRTYDVRTGAIGPRAVHVRVSGGLPDGIAMDADDHLWVAVWGAGKVCRHDPSGAVVGHVQLPVPHVTSIAFAGDDLREMVVTTARSELTAQEREDHPNAGALFRCRVDTPGHPVPLWRSSSSPDL